MKWLNKYYWFFLITGLFLFDSGIGNLYLLIYPNITTQEELNKAIQIYVMCKGLTVSLLYFYLAYQPLRPPNRDIVDMTYGVLCGVISVYSSVKFLFFAQETSQAYYWALYFIFTVILLTLRIKKR